MGSQLSVLRVAKTSNYRKKELKVKTNKHEKFAKNHPYSQQGLQGVVMRFLASGHFVIFYVSMKPNIAKCY